MAQLAGDARGAAKRPAVDDHSRADPRGQLQVDRRARRAGGSQGHLGEGSEIGVVVDVDRGAEPFAQVVRGVDAHPSLEDRGVVEPVAGGVHGARQRHSDGQDHAGGEARAVERFGHQLGGALERARRVVIDVELGRRFGEDVARQVGDRDLDAGVVEVDSDGDSRRRVESQHHRGPADRRRARLRVAVALGDEPALVQVGHQRRDRRARQAGDPGDLGPAQRPVTAQGVDHAQPVELAQGLERSRAVRHPTNLQGRG
jgi:hypothetical protein